MEPTYPSSAFIVNVCQIGKRTIIPIIILHVQPNIIICVKLTSKYLCIYEPAGGG